jgi:hypothetical protein
MLRLTLGRSRRTGRVDVRLVGSLACRPQASYCRAHVPPYTCSSHSLRDFNLSLRVR